MPQSAARDALDEKRLRRLIDVGRALVSELDLEVVLTRVLETARELTGARYAALGILDEQREQLERFITSGVDDATRAAIGDLPHGRGVLGILIREPQPLRLDDVGRHPRSYGFPPNHPPMKSFLGVPIMVRGEAYGNLYLTEKNGGPFDAADEQAAVVLADWSAIAIENARLYSSESERRNHLEHTVRRLEATTEIARALGGETDLGRVLELIVKRGRALVEAQSLLILVAEGEDFVVAATAGDVDHDEAMGARIASSRSPLAWLLKSGRIERVTDIAGPLPVPLGEGSLAAALIVPLSFHGENLGALAAFNRTVDGPQFSLDDAALMQSFAASAATAFRTAKSVAEERLRHSIEASEQERRRWARELHDETLQGLGGLRLLLSSALQKGSGDDLDQAIRSALEEIGLQIQSLRGLVSELRPAALDELGLEPAIESLVARTQAAQGISVRASIELSRGDAHSARLAPEIETTVYRLVQESLNNVIKHAGAQSAEVAVRALNGNVSVEVRDDGAGFDPEASVSGFGLAGMHERVELAGGSLTVSSSPGEGTLVHALLPAPPVDGQRRRIS